MKPQSFGQGLNHLDPATGQFRHFRHEDQVTGSISSNAITSIFRDRQGILWIGTYGGGLNRLDPESQTFKPYRHDPGDDRSISSDRVLAVY